MLTLENLRSILDPKNKGLGEPMILYNQIRGSALGSAQTKERVNVETDMASTRVAQSVHTRFRWERPVLLALAVVGTVAIVSWMSAWSDRRDEQRRAERVMLTTVGSQLEIIWGRTHGVAGADEAIRAGAWAEAAYDNYGAALQAPDRLGFRFNELDAELRKTIKDGDCAVRMIPVVEPGELEGKWPDITVKRNIPAAFLDLDGVLRVPVVKESGQASPVPVKDFPVFLKEHGVNPAGYADPQTLRNGKWVKIKG